jgi:hypothetical protein
MPCTSHILSHVLRVSPFIPFSRCCRESLGLTPVAIGNLGQALGKLVSLRDAHLDFDGVNIELRDACEALGDILAGLPNMQRWSLRSPGPVDPYS